MCKRAPAAVEGTAYDFETSEGGRSFYLRRSWPFPDLPPIIRAVGAGLFPLLPVAWLLSKVTELVILCD